MSLESAAHKISEYMSSVSIPYIGEQNVALMNSLSNKLDTAATSGDTEAIQAVFKQIAHTIPRIVKGGFVSKAYLNAVETAITQCRDAVRYSNMIDNMISRSGIGRKQKALELFSNITGFSCGWLETASKKLSQVTQYVQRLAESYMNRLQGAQTDKEALFAISGFSDSIKTVLERTANRLKKAITSDRIVGKFIKKRLMRVISMIRKAQRLTDLEV